MNEANILLKAYYEALHELLICNRESLEQKIETTLRDQVQHQNFDIDDEKFTAYFDASTAFLAVSLELSHAYKNALLHNKIKVIFFIVFSCWC